MTIKGNITRTFITVYAQGFVIDGINNDGTPKLTAVKSAEYVTVNPNDMATAKREVKRVNKRVIVDTVQVVEVSSEVRSMSLDDFYAASTPVERAANGRINS